MHDVLRFWLRPRRRRLPHRRRAPDRQGPRARRHPSRASAATTRTGRPCTPAARRSAACSTEYRRRPGRGRRGLPARPARRSPRYSRHRRRAAPRASTSASCGRRGRREAFRGRGSHESSRRSTRARRLARPGCLNNHDQPADRHALRRRRGRAWPPCSCSTLRGTPFLYQGEELGLADADVPPERVVDLDGRDRLPGADPVDRPPAGLTTGDAVAADPPGRRRASASPRRPATRGSALELYRGAARAAPRDARAAARGRIARSTRGARRLRLRARHGEAGPRRAATSRRSRGRCRADGPRRCSPRTPIRRPASSRATRRASSRSLRRQPHALAAHAEPVRGVRRRARSVAGSACSALAEQVDERLAVVDRQRDLRPRARPARGRRRSSSRPSRSGGRAPTARPSRARSSVPKPSSGHSRRRRISRSNQFSSESGSRRCAATLTCSGPYAPSASGRRSAVGVVGRREAAVRARPTTASATRTL